MNKTEWRNKRSVTAIVQGRAAADPANPKTGIASFSLTPRHVAWLNKTARTLNVSRSFIIQLALERLMGAATESKNEAPG